MYITLCYTLGGRWVTHVGRHTFFLMYVLPMWYLPISILYVVSYSMYYLVYILYVVSTYCSCCFLPIEWCLLGAAPSGHIRLFRPYVRSGSYRCATCSQHGAVATMLSSFSTYSLPSVPCARQGMATPLRLTPSGHQRHSYACPRLHSQLRLATRLRYACALR